MALSHKVLIELVAKGDQAKKEFEKTAQSVNQLGGAQKTQGGIVASTTGFLRSNAAALGAVAVAAGVGLKVVSASVGAYTSWASKVREVQRVSGTTAEQASGLTYAFEKLGLGAEGGAKAIFMLEKRIGSGKSHLANYGVEVQRTAAGSVDLIGTLGNLADAYQRTQDPAKRAAMIQESFGRVGAQMIPILAKGREGIKALFAEAGRTNHILSDEDLARAKEFTLATKELSATFEGIKIKIGNALTPVLTDLTQAATTTTQLASSAGLLDAAGGALHNFFAGPLQGLQNLHDTGVALGLVHDEVDKTAEANKRLSDAQSKVNDYIKSGKTHSRDYRDAQKELREAQAGVNKIQTEQLAATGALAQAQERLAQKADTYKAATRAVKDAQREQVAGDVDAIQAAKDLAQATDQVTQAKEREAGAISNSVGSLLAAQSAERALGQDLLKNAEGYQITQDAAALADARVADYATTVQATTGHVLTNQERLAKQREELVAIAAQYPQTAAQILPLIQRIDELTAKSDVKIGVTANTGQANAALDGVIRKLSGIASFGIKAATSLFVDGAGAAGGYVPPNSTWLVGEKGPEIIQTGSQSGWITPNNQIGTWSGSASGGAVYNVTVNTMVATAETGRHVVNALKAYERGNGSAWRQ